MLKYLPKNTAKLAKKGELGELGELVSAPTVSEHIYNPSQNDQKTSSFDDTTKTDYFLSSCTRILNNEQENAPIDPNDKKVKCGDCKYYTFDCEKGIEVTDENTLHVCKFFEVYVKHSTIDMEIF